MAKYYLLLFIIFVIIIIIIYFIWCFLTKKKQFDIAIFGDNDEHARSNIFTDHRLYDYQFCHSHRSLLFVFNYLISFSTFIFFPIF